MDVETAVILQPLTLGGGIALTYKRKAHGRFVRGQLQEDLVFAGDDQDDWVRVRRYQDRP